MACRQMNLSPRLGVLSRVLRRCRHAGLPKCRLSLSQISRYLRPPWGSCQVERWYGLTRQRTTGLESLPFETSHVATRKHPLRLIPKYFSERFSNSLSPFKWSWPKLQQASYWAVPAAIRFNWGSAPQICCWSFIQLLASNIAQTWEIGRIGRI